MVLKNIALILPDDNFNIENYHRLLDQINYFFRKENFELIHYCIESSCEYYKEKNINTRNLPLNKNGICYIQDSDCFFGQISDIVVMKDYFNNNPSFQWKLKNINVYKDEFFGYGGLRLVSGKHKVRENIFFKIHNNKSEYVYSPYSFMFQRDFFNDTDELGLRNEYELKTLCKRDANHKVIAIFGGSAVFDINTIKSFSNILEEKLNKNGRNKYTVLNFGLCGGVLLNSIMLYTMYLWEVNPDIVISYDGFNDFLNGQFADTFLQKKYDLNYTSIYEEWARALNSNFNDYHPNRINTSSDIIIKSYYQRKIEFQEMIRNRDKMFISVLQPFIYSKKKISKEEKRLWAFIKNSDIELAAYNIKVLYVKYLHYLSEKKGLYNTLDLHNVFSKFDSNDSLFADIVHTLPLGSEIIAKELFTYILSLES